MRPQRRFHGMRSVTGVPGAMLLAVVSLLDLDALQAFDDAPPQGVLGFCRRRLN